jgi:hypothetical protein
LVYIVRNIFTIAGDAVCIARLIASNISVELLVISFENFAVSDKIFLCDDVNSLDVLGRSFDVSFDNELSVPVLSFIKSLPKLFMLDNTLPVMPLKAPTISDAPVLTVASTPP